MPLHDTSPGPVEGAPRLYSNKPVGNITRTTASVGSFSTAWQITGVVVAAGQNVRLMVQAMVGTPARDSILTIVRGSTQSPP